LGLSACIRGISGQPVSPADRADYRRVILGLFCVHQRHPRATCFLPQIAQIIAESFVGLSAYICEIRGTQAHAQKKEVFINHIKQKSAEVFPQRFLL